MLVEGDDAEIVLPRRYWSALGMSRYEAFLASCGIVPEVDVCRTYATDYDDPLPPSVFCSTHFVLLSDGSPMLIIFNGAPRK